MREGRRIVVTSGGHCLEGFVSDPDVNVIVDASLMKGIRFDAARGAIEVGAGATVGETFRANHDLWWGLTGAGGGNFGIVTRQWFRSSGAAREGSKNSTGLLEAPELGRRDTRPAAVLAGPTVAGGLGRLVR
jgi:FAD/FMN-containing dehydrogenase